MLKQIKINDATLINKMFSLYKFQQSHQLFFNCPLFWIYLVVKYRYFVCNKFIWSSMGKKKNDRVVIDGHSAPRQEKKIDKQKINDFQRKKTVANFEFGRQQKLSQPPGYQRSYIGFNYDHRKFTPAFVYENDLRGVDKYKESYLSKLKAAKEYVNNAVKPPQPREKKNRIGYCSICKSNYDKYFEHVRSKEHVKKMNESEFTRGLKKIEGFFIERKERRARAKKYREAQ